MSLWPLYSLATRAATPIARIILARRANAGKEDPARLGERWGRTALVRPAGKLIWLHAASVGEAVSLLAVIDVLLQREPDAQALVTTGTVTSARMMAARLPADRARHQYVPLDHPPSIRRFLDHWRPDVAIWVELELWPNLILETHRRGIPMALLNARMSERSLRGWRRAPGLIRALLRCFGLVLAQDGKQAALLRDLGAENAGSVGDLKAAAPALAVDQAVLQNHRALIGNRPVWLAASTHPGEEAIVAAAHRDSRGNFPGVLTLLAPRHPIRASDIATALRADGLSIARRSAGETPGATTDIWLVDTMGELGLFYRLTPVTLVAGSLGSPGSVGGHNPLEAAAIGSAVLHGRDMVNCLDSAAKLDTAGAALEVTDAASLANTVAALLADPNRARAMGNAARRVADAERGVVDAVIDRLMSLMAHARA